MRSWGGKGPGGPKVKRIDYQMVRLHGGLKNPHAMWGPATSAGPGRVQVGSEHFSGKRFWIMNDFWQR